MVDTNTVPGSDSSWTLISGAPEPLPARILPLLQTLLPADISAPSDSSSGTDVSTPSDTSSGTDTSSPADTSSGTSSSSSSGTDSVLPYSPTTVYFAGNKVTYNGIAYTAKWYALGNTPGDPDGPWRRLPGMTNTVLKSGTKERFIQKASRPITTESSLAGQMVDEHRTGIWFQLENMTNPGTDESSSDTDSSSGTDSSTDSGSGASAVTKYSDYTVDASLVANGNSTFRTVGYFPFYSASKADDIDYSCLTNLIYAFAFPDGNGGLQALDDTALVQKLIADGHAAGVQVQLGVGGWAYYGTIEEYQFDGCTATPALIDKFTDAIVALVNQYGFDGVDVDWEHPRFGTDSYKHYEAMMISLRQKLGNESSWLRQFFQAWRQTEPSITMPPPIQPMSCPSATGSMSWPMTANAHWTLTRAAPTTGAWPAACLQIKSVWEFRSIPIRAGQPMRIFLHPTPRQPQTTWRGQVITTIRLPL